MLSIVSGQLPENSMCLPKPGGRVGGQRWGVGVGSRIYGAPHGQRHQKAVCVKDYAVDAQRWVKPRISSAAIAVAVGAVGAVGIAFTPRALAGGPALGAR